MGELHDTQKIHISQKNNQRLRIHEKRRQPSLEKLLDIMKRSSSRGSHHSFRFGKWRVRSKRLEEEEPSDRGICH